MAQIQILGHVSIIYMIGSSILFIVKCLNYMKKNSLEYIDIKDDAMQAYNEKIQNKLSGNCLVLEVVEAGTKQKKGKIVNNYPGYGIEVSLDDG